MEICVVSYVPAIRVRGVMVGNRVVIVAVPVLVEHITVIGKV